MHSDPFDRDAMRASVPRFLELYASRPIRDNPFGMALNHSWATWYLLDQLRPALVVESGVWQGHSTWLIERTLPDARILSFDIDLSNRRYISSHATYAECDLSAYDWSHLEKSSALVFLDDHQNAYERLQLMGWLGFDRIIFEDNHPPGFGDFYTLQHMRAGAGYPPARELMAQSRARATAKRLVRGVRRRLGSLTAVRPNTADWANASSRIARNEEMPALQVDPGDYYGQPYSMVGHTLEQLLPQADFSRHDLRYNWLTYVELGKPEEATGVTRR